MSRSAGRRDASGGSGAPGAPRIVVGVDGSECSVRALDWAVAEARRTGAALQLVSAWIFPMALGYAFTLVDATTPLPTPAPQDAA